MLSAGWKRSAPMAVRCQSARSRKHDALEGARPCRARIRPPAELDGQKDRAHHRHRAGEVQDRDDEPRLQHPSAGSARAGGGCARLSALTGGIRVASCKGPRGHRPGAKTAPAPARSAKAEIAESGYCSRRPIVYFGLTLWWRTIPDGEPVLQQRHRTACWLGEAPMRCPLSTCGANCTVSGLIATHQLRGRDQRGQLFRVEHTRLYRGLGDADYLGNLLDGFRSA